MEENGPSGSCDSGQRFRDFLLTSVPTAPEKLQEHSVTLILTVLKKRDKKLDLVFVCFTDYDETIGKLVAFRKEEITNTFGRFLAAHGKTQARIAETEKYAHVTFFFNGGIED